MDRLFLPLLAGAVLLAGVANAQALRLRVDQWIPVNGDPAATHPGYAIEIAHAVFDSLGVKIDYQTMPWADVLEAVQHGEIDGVIGAGDREAGGLVVPEEKIGEPRTCLFTLTTSAWKFKNVTSLAGLRIGCIEGYSCWDFLDDYIKARPEQCTVLKGDAALSEGIALLLAGKIDVLPEVLPVFAWTLKELGHSLGEFRPAYTQLGEAISIAFSPKDPAAKQRAREFDAGVRRLRASGELKKILEPYAVEDWQ